MAITVITTQAIYCYNKLHLKTLAMKVYKRLQLFGFYTLIIMLALNVSSCSETDAILDEICNNGKDDDGDGFIDSEDNDCTETGTECSNGKDDDGDGFIDGDDLDCTETGTECSNGKDDDGDGFIDSDDLDCTETGTECSNGKDDDGDGFTDCDDVDCNGNPNC